MADGEKIPIDPKDIPESLLQEVYRFACDYSVALVYGDGMIGSGTLIKWGREHGILTAQHVRAEIQGRRAEKLRIPVMMNRVSSLGFDAAHLDFIDIGIPERAGSSPDLSIVKLPRTSSLGTLKAKYLFYDVVLRRENKLKAAMLEGGIWLMVGHPSDKVSDSVARWGSPNSVHCPRMGIIGSLLGRSKKGIFDYLEIGVYGSAEDGSLRSYKGFSGGGVWSAPLAGDAKTLQLALGKPVLAGVAFYQTDVEDNCRRIRCHGPKSIYEALTSCLEEGRLTEGAAPP